VTVKLRNAASLNVQVAHNRLPAQEIKLMGYDPAEDRSPGSDDKTPSAEDQSKLSATGMFAAVPADPPAAPATAPPVIAAAASAAPVPPEPPAVSPPASQPGMPVVHEVVFPSSTPGASESSGSILSSLRALAADEKSRVAELPSSAFVKSEPSAPKPDASATFVQSPASAGFTQLLRALSEKPGTQQAPPASQLPAPPTPEPTQTPSSSAASFTRLLRALDVDSAARPASAADTAPIPGRVESPARSAPASDIWKPAQSQPEVQREPETIAASPTPFADAPTTIFQSPTIDRAPASAPKVEPTPSSAGSFTQLFEAIAPEATKAADRPAPAADKPPVPAPSPDVAQSSGSFTQLFKAIDSSPHPTPSPAPATTIQPAAQASPGTFTQLFHAIDPGSQSTQAPPAPQASAKPLPPEEHSPGSFTQLFQAVDPAAAPTPAPPLAPATPLPAKPAFNPPAVQSGGSFTELFRAIDPSDTPPPPKPASFQPLSNMAAAPATTPEPQPASSFTQMFRAADSATPATPTVRPAQSWSQAPQSQPGVIPPSFPSAPFTPEPQPSESSNLTQFLRTLDQSGTSPEPPIPPPASRPDAFTSLYGERQPMTTPVERMQSAPAPNFSQPPRTEFAGPGSSIPSESPQASGSSDFTRIIQASSLREQALKRGEQSIEAARPATPSAPPPAQPQMPAFPSATAPQFPHPSVLPPVNFGHGGMTPQAQPFKPAAPHINVNPAQWMPPEPPPPAPAPAARTQPLLPLILIGIIFVLVVVLVAVVFLMKH
jgi:hypothetical protein